MIPDNKNRYFNEVDNKVDIGMINDANKMIKEDINFFELILLFLFI
jgi:hypothetical protein